MPDVGGTAFEDVTLVGAGVPFVGEDFTCATLGVSSSEDESSLLSSELIFLDYHKSLITINTTSASHLAIGHRMGRFFRFRIRGNIILCRSFTLALFLNNAHERHSIITKTDDVRQT